jgi:hypothetical protein
MRWRRDSRADGPRAASWRVRGLVGGLLLAASWWVSWQRGRAASPTAWTFFTLWLGYILVMDALVQRRTGSSPFRRSRRRWLGLFLFSIPAWWLFEGLNHFLGNWLYLGREHYGPLAYALLASVSFSTVIPAVFTTAELVASLPWPRRLAHGPRLALTLRALAAWIALGLLLLAGVALWPRVLFPAAWLCLFFILDPINDLLGWPSIAGHVRQGDWRLVVVLGLAALACGFFWELWNVHAYPKWVYDIPYVCERPAGPCPIGRVFEMPWLGYGGYIPFGLELYALFRFASGLAGFGLPWDLRFDRREEVSGATPPTGAVTTC